jgi:hypothetical protein
VSPCWPMIVTFQQSKYEDRRKLYLLLRAMKQQAAKTHAKKEMNREIGRKRAGSSERAEQKYIYRGGLICLLTSLFFVDIQDPEKKNAGF